MSTWLTRYAHARRQWLGLLAALALAAGALLVLAASASAAGRAAGGSAPATVFVVASHLDFPDDHPGDGFCHTAVFGVNCTLRAAIDELNAEPSGGGINLPGGVYTLTDTTDGDLQIRHDINLGSSGPGLAVIQGKPGWGFRILRVQSGANVILSGVAISGGHVAATQLGGGLDVVSGTVRLIDSLVTNNLAGNGGGIANSSQLIVDRSTVRQNGAYTNGGGIYNAPPLTGTVALTMNLDLVGDNNADLEAGGLYNQGRAVIMTSTFILNEGLLGGGIVNINGGVLSMSGSAILANQSLAGQAGGLMSGGLGAVAQLANTTVSGNSAAAQGGGLVEFAGELDLYNVTVVSNTGNSTATGPDPAGGGLYGILGTFIVRDSLIAHNVDRLNKAPDCSGQFSLAAYDFVQNTQGCGAIFNNGVGDITGTDPLLTPLGFYGGPTLTYGLQPGSPAARPWMPATSPAVTSARRCWPSTSAASPAAPTATATASPAATWAPMSYGSCACSCRCWSANDAKSQIHCARPATLMAAT